MGAKTVLLIDDEQGYLEPLSDALTSLGVRVLIARTASAGLQVLDKEHVDLVTVDIMMDPGPELADKVDSHSAGVFVCREIRRLHPDVSVFCLSVVNDSDTIRQIRDMGVWFLRKGETPLKTVLDRLRSSLTGVAFSTDERDLRF
jgi:DNA-binding response OmpR family regulator